MKKRLLLWNLVLLAAFFMMSCAYPAIDPEEESQQMVEVLGAPAEDLDALPAYRINPGDVLELIYHFETGTRTDFRLQPQDQIEIKFPEAPELNENQRIRPDGKISLAYIGDITAAGLTTPELQRKLKQQYSATLRNPEVYVVVREFGGTVNQLKEAITTSTRGQSKLILVRSDGEATFPLLGDLKVVGMTINEVSDMVNSSYAQKVSKDMVVSLMLNQTGGSSIAVVGAVAAPGFYTINRPVSAVEAIALAGGFRNDANLTNVVAIRRDRKTIKAKALNVADMMRGKPGVTQMYLQTNDILYVPRTRLAVTAEVVQQIANVLLFRGFGVTYSLNADSDITIGGF